MSTKACLGIFCCAALMLFACAENNGETLIHGTIDSASADYIYLETERIHYKFSEPERIKSEIDAQGNFSFPLNTSTAALYTIFYKDNSFPVYIEPGKQTKLHIRDAHFPRHVRAEGFAADHYKAYRKYLNELASVEQHKRTERQNFRRGKPGNYLNIKRLRLQIAKEYLGDTPFSDIVHRHTGEYLVARLELIRHKKNDTGFNQDLARRSVLNEARYLGFFSANSLKAQRAGIRDFAHEWVHTFGIREELEHNNVTFATGSWIDEAAEMVRDKKWELLNYIDEAQARSHAAMYIIAEELGDYDFEAGVELLSSNKDILGNEPGYLAFLEQLKDEVGHTQPGNPAIPFTIPDQYGNAVSLEDFRGSYVLLDFWAGWCMPCIEQLPYMKEIYESYDRSDLNIVSISVEESEEAWRQALERHPHPWSQLYDGRGFDQETFRAYRAGGIPFYVLIGRDGTILRNNDFRPSTNLPDILDQLIYEDYDHTYAGW